MAPQVLRITPVNVQVRHRATFFPPNYRLVTTEIAAALAGRLAEVFNLKSSGIIFNQNAMSTQYLSLRYVPPNQPIRYLDALIGVDQAEITFLNPASASELKDECLKAWTAIVEKSKPNITDQYFEATFHCTTDGKSVAEFLDKFVNIKSDAVEIQKGFSLTTKHPEINGEARIGLEVSTSVPNGLYVIFGFVSKRKIEDLASLKNVIDAIINVYRALQSLAHIDIVEPA
jgi:hypothetical protein